MGILLPVTGILLISLIPLPGITNPGNITSLTYSAANNSAEIFPGDFINEQGELLGNDGRNDGKLYVIKTAKSRFESFGEVNSAGISDSMSKVIENFIRHNSGDTSAFAAYPFVYSYVQELEMSKEVRQKMLDIVNRDDGNGDTVAGNNREYGGTVDKMNKIKESLPGNVCDPSTGAGAGINIQTGTATKYLTGRVAKIPLLLYMYTILSRFPNTYPTILPTL